MKKITGNTLNIIFAILLGVMWLSGEAAFAKTIQVIDSSGKDLIFTVSPKRVVSLVPSATEILFEIGADQAVVGLSYHDAALKRSEQKALIGGFFLPSVERIKALKPDLIILANFHQQISKELKAAGFRIFVYDTKSIEHSFETIMTFGKLFNRQEQAGQVIAKNKKQIAHIQNKLAKAVPDKRKRVIRLMGRDKVMTPGNDSFQNELIRLSGGIAPDFGKKGSVIDVTREEWMAFNPQVIYGCGGDKKAAEKFFSRPGWNQVDAVKNHQIFYFPCELTCRAATHSGYFVQWLSSMVYTDEFAKPKNNIFPIKTIHSKPVKLDLAYVKSAVINTSTIYDFDNKTLMVDFKRPQTIVSTLEGQRDDILTVGNHYSPPPTWGVGHKMGIDHIRTSILKANNKDAASTSFLITGADMGNLSVKEARFKEMTVTALVTAGVMSNAVRMSQDTGQFYEPGTINIIIMTNMQLSNRAMTRAIIAATEAKTAALEDLDIRSSYTPLVNPATGTGTDNILVVKGEGTLIKNAGGHTKMGELIAKAVYAGVNQAILKQNKITTNRHIFQRLKERKISLHNLTSGVNCDCMNEKSIPKKELSKKIEHLLLEKKYAAFIETAFTISDDYERGLIKDLTLFHSWCKSVASTIAGKKIDTIKDYLTDHQIPIVLKTALNALIAGQMAENQAIPQRVVSLSPIITETIYLVGAQDKLIANTTYCLMPEAAKYKEKIGSVIQMNVEKIIRLKPDLVIASALSREKQLKILEKLSIRIVRAKNPKTFDQMCDMTVVLGKTLGKSDKAKRIVDKARKQASAILKQTKGLKKPSVFLQIGLKPLHSANKDMFINEYIRYGGGINIAEHEGSGVYSREKVLAVDPDIILIATMGTSKKAGILERDKWLTYKNMKAVKSNRVHVLDPEMICSPTPSTFIKGLSDIVPLLHPEQAQLILTGEKN